MRTFTRGYAAIAGLATLALVVTACGGSSKPTSTPTSSLAPAGQEGLNPGTGAPQKGGTLNLLGTGDVTYMDPNISYYSTDYQGQRMWIRNLYTYPAIVGQTTTQVPDLATGPPTISSDGLTYTVTIRTGAMWDTSPPRQVTAADALLGLKRACNPALPWGGLPDFENLLVGYATFCTGFGKVSPTSASAQKQYIDSHQISGVTTSGETITYKLVHPAEYFKSILGLPPFNPAPVESLAYVPATAASQQHTIADGPYTVQSYTPTRSIVFVRNPAWNASADPIRKAYVDKIVVNETGQPETIQQQLQTNTAAASAEWDAPPPVAAVPGLINQMKAGGQNFTLGSTYSTNPYVIFNEVSPNNGGALGKVAVRQALSYGINRAHLIQDDNGPEVSPPLTHILPAGIGGSQNVPAGYNPYPYDTAKAKQMLAAAGYPNGLTLKMLYRPASTLSAKIFQTLQADLATIGVKVTGVGVPNADFYAKYLAAPNAKTIASKGTWDISLAGWSPDWYGDSAVSFFNPLFSGPPSFPPSGSNFGFYDNPAVNTMIAQAASTASVSAADALWGQLDQKVMQDAPIYPITDGKWPLYHASYVHNAVYLASTQSYDPTNMWLSTP
jgi:peptide/nickel transport system substrate-binding protein